MNRRVQPTVLLFSDCRLLPVPATLPLQWVCDKTIVEWFKIQGKNKAGRQSHKSSNGIERVCVLDTLLHLATVLSVLLLPFSANHTTLAHFYPHPCGKMHSEDTHVALASPSEDRTTRRLARHQQPPPRPTRAGNAQRGIREVRLSREGRRRGRRRRRARTTATGCSRRRGTTSSRQTTRRCVRSSASLGTTGWSSLSPLRLQGRRRCGPRCAGMRC